MNVSSGALVGLGIITTLITIMIGIMLYTADAKNALEDKKRADAQAQEIQKKASNIQKQLNNFSGSVIDPNTGTKIQVPTPLSSIPD